MAANRKLQGEIDRTLKKVQEGVELFDEIWEKVYGAQNQNQKEKFESELKSQIKKLQRYRDDIKTWITNSDIKDKRPLTDARKLIETEMERFKVCEKEFKTKAFSKEGLSQAPKEDPKEKEKNKVRKWVGAALETIQERKDVYEAELETINTAKKKKKDAGAAKWEDLIERCRYHEERLELILRLIDNDSLAAEDVEQIKEQLEYLLEQMVDGNTDEVDGIDDDSIYEDLGLDELSGAGDEDGGGAVVEKVAESVSGSSKAAEKTPDKKKSLLNKPEPSDSERPRTYVPRNPYPTPNSFPQTPAAVFDAPSTFDKFDTDTLFFIFYYQQGTYQQYLAARELKKQSWRYHKKYLTWFQRHEEPKVTAEDYEQGTYVYFDYETGWCQRIKSDFTFEYGYLEDELQV